MSVCLFVNGGGASEEHAAALALQHDPALGPQGEVLLGKASGRSRELSAVTGPNQAAGTAPCGAPGPSAGCHLPGRRGWGTQSGRGAGHVCHLSLQGPTPRRGWVPALQGQRGTLRPGATLRPWLPGRVWGCHRACQSSSPPPSSSCDFAAGRHRTVVITLKRVTHSVRYVRSVVQPSPLTFQNVPLLQIGMRPVGSHRPPSQRPPVPGQHRPPLCQPLRTFPEWSHNPWPPTPRFCRPGLRGSSSDR